MSNIKSWDLASVREHYDLVAYARKTGKQIYFGRLFPLCHIKHSELAAQFHVYKGRVVFGGHDVRDEEGIKAVFQEQGTSASHMVCAKILDALARMPNMSGREAVCPIG